MRVPHWKNLPIGTRITLREASGLLGITQQSLVANYTGTNPPRKFPVPISVIRENGRAILLIREADE
jgi:hypothetical protein